MVKPDITRVYETLVPDSSSGKDANFIYLKCYGSTSVSKSEGVGSTPTGYAISMTD